MKRIISVLIVAVLALSLCACGGGKDEADPDGTRIIVDALGREVEIPVKVETIAPLGNAPRILSYLGVQDRFVTITPSDLNETPFMAYGWANRELWTDLPIGASGGYGVFHPEVLIEAAPDVILCTYEADIVEDIASQTGLPVVAVAQGTLFGEDYEEALRIFADVCGVPERAEALIAYIHECLDDLAARCATVPDDERPLVLGAAATFRGGHGMNGVYCGIPVLVALNANDAAAGIEKESHSVGVEVDLEQILEWDPDYIFLDAGNMDLVRAEYGENPSFFEHLKAFSEGRAYVWANSTSNYTNVEIPLVNCYYVGKILYPEAFSDVDFDAKAAEIFDMFLGGGGAEYLDVLRNAGAYREAVLD